MTQRVGPQLMRIQGCRPPKLFGELTFFPIWREPSPRGDTVRQIFRLLDLRQIARFLLGASLGGVSSLAPRNQERNQNHLEHMSECSVGPTVGMPLASPEGAFPLEAEVSEGDPSAR
jgi:hypothetical protein